jgi:putative pre-16S rRNA nuclease
MTAQATVDVMEFKATLPAVARLLGIDLGTKTIGLSLSDAGRSLAVPLLTLKRAKFGADTSKLARICADNTIAGIVLGLPLNMDGSVGPRAQSAKAYGINLARALGLAVLLFDERLSTFAAEESMIEAGVSHARRARRIDAAAAAVILQDALNQIGRD